MAAGHHFLFLSVSLLAASLSVEGQEDLSQLREDMAAYRRQLEDMRHEMEAQRNEVEAQIQREKELKHEVRELREGLQQQERQIQVLQETCRHPKAGDPQLQEAASSAPAWRPHTHVVDNKRSDDIGALEPVLSQVTQRLDVVTADIQAIQNVNTRQDQAIAQHDQAQGTVYMRWGGRTCPNGTETLYSGFMAGAMYNAGSAVNYLCLPPVPVFDDHPLPHYRTADLYGTEYETCHEPECDMTAMCSVCRTPRQAQVMVPGTNVCQDGWHLEYSGYIMTQLPGQAYSEYICVDSRHDYFPGTQGSQDGKLLYYTVVRCTSLSCPPYVDNKIVPCAVCSK